MNKLEKQLNSIRNLLLALLAVGFIAGAILSTSTIISTNVSATSKQIGEQNRTFLENFSDYMHCLVVVDEVAYEQLGKAAYFAECDKLLFRGTGIDPHKREPVATISTSEGTTTSVSAIIGG